MVDGLVSLLAIDTAEKEVDRLLLPPTPSPPPSEAGGGGGLGVAREDSGCLTPRGSPVTLSQAGVKALRRRYTDLKALSDR